jgi:XTP/dITP diphosphohydrolase
MPKLLIATRNAGKLRELSQLLYGIPFQLTSLDQEGIDVVVDETGTTLEENAKLKATLCASASNLLTLADDSALEVDALDGEPGVRSARYAGENASDADRVSYLLSKLQDIPWEKRTARFRCVIAIAHPSGEVKLCEGQCHGIVCLEPRGKQGFGYDPIFYFAELDKTMAELTPEEKNKLSHRGRAAEKARQLLSHLRLSSM